VLSIPINDGKHIESIIGSTACGRHSAQRGVACWAIPRDPGPKGDNTLLAVCGARIRKHGYNGKISATALQLKRHNLTSNKKEVRA
jgi:hypothetical protein